MYEESALRELVAPFSESNVGASTGAKLIVEDGRDHSAGTLLEIQIGHQEKRNHFNFLCQFGG